MFLWAVRIVFCSACRACEESCSLSSVSAGLSGSSWGDVGIIFSPHCSHVKAGAFCSKEVDEEGLCYYGLQDTPGPLMWMSKSCSREDNQHEIKCILITNAELTALPLSQAVAALTLFPTLCRFSWLWCFGDGCCCSGGRRLSSHRVQGARKSPQSRDSLPSAGEMAGTINRWGVLCNISIQQQLAWRVFFWT